jgi:predicted MPP superfamily phosphohydrolase
MARRIGIGITFLLVVLAVGIGGHLYLALRLLLQPQWPGPVRWGLLGLLVAGFSLIFLQLFARRRLPLPLARSFAWGAYVWLGFAFLLITATGASDAVVWLLGSAPASGALDFVSVARVRALVVAGVAVLAAAAALRSGLAPPCTRRVEIELGRWPASLDGFRIVQVSDLHIGPLLDRRFAAQVFEQANALQPDLIAVTGDLADGSVQRLQTEVEPLAGLRARHGVFFVTGNHDHYSGVQAWTAKVRELGWRVLRNERIRVGGAGASFELAGVDDHHGSLVDAEAGEDLDGALSGRDPSVPVVLLAHDPSTFREASRRGVDLQLSGHTHGGQIWPFHWVVRAFIPWVAGLHRLEGSTLYVSRGTGFWGPPMRLLAPAEITEIVLRAS